MAVRLAPGTDTLGAALKVLEQRGRMHGGLKAAFGNLYGYSSDEEGVRHALVFGDEAQVDEADALFMLGACASLVSYLLARKLVACGDLSGPLPGSRRAPKYFRVLRNPPSSSPPFRSSPNRRPPAPNGCTR